MTSHSSPSENNTKHCCSPTNKKRNYESSSVFCVIRQRRFWKEGERITVGATHRVFSPLGGLLSHSPRKLTSLNYICLWICNHDVSPSLFNNQTIRKPPRGLGGKQDSLRLEILSKIFYGFSPLAFFRCYSARKSSMISSRWIGDSASRLHRSTSDVARSRSVVRSVTDRMMMGTPASV